MTDNTDTNKTNPVVSVIITTYNRSEFLKESVYSVLSQTFKDFELIIVNDASHDDTSDVIRQFTDPRLIYVQHSTNRGGPAARNSGIKIAHGSYIAFLDDDDLWLPQKLEKQVNKLNQVGADIGLIYAGSEIRGADDNKLISTQYPKARGDVRRCLLSGSLFGSVSKALIKKECFDNVGLFDETFKSCQDWDMWFRIAEKYKFDFVNEILSLGRMHAGQLSANYPSIIAGRISMINKHLEAFKVYPSTLAAHYKQIAKLNCLNGTMKEASVWFKKAIAIKPFESVKIFIWLFIEFPFIKIIKTIKPSQRM